MNNKNSSPNIISVVLVILMGLLLQACSSGAVAAGQSTSTQDIPTIASANYTPCPPVTPVVFPVETKPRVIYVLIDRSGSYSRHTENAIDILVEGLRVSLQFGDKLHLIWLGESTDATDASWLIETISSQPYPDLHPPIASLTATNLPATASPTLLSIPASETPTFTPTLNPDAKPTGVLVNIEAEQKATQEAIARQETAVASMETARVVSIIETNVVIAVEKEINKYYCAQTELNTKNDKIIYERLLHQQTIANDFINNVLLPLKEESITADDQGTLIYDALYHAARTIRQEKDTNSFSSYYLIILSDMDDIGSYRGEKLDVDLTNVKVFIPMLSCKRAMDCQNRPKYWKQYFLNHGAILPPEPFWTIYETTPDLISDFLK